MNKRGTKGFTLIEIVVVVAIIAVLLALIAPGVVGAVKSAQRTSDENELKTLNVATQVYKAHLKQAHSDIFYDLYTNDARLHRLLDEGYITSIPKTQQTDAAFLWNVDKQVWELYSMSSGTAVTTMPITTTSSATTTTTTTIPATTTTTTITTTTTTAATTTMPSNKYLNTNITIQPSYWPKPEDYSTDWQTITVNPAGVFKYSDGNYYVVNTAVTLSKSQAASGPGGMVYGWYVTQKLTGTIVTFAPGETDKTMTRGDICQVGNDYYVFKDGGSVGHSPTTSPEQWYKLP